MERSRFVGILLLVLLLGGSPDAWATEEFAAQTGLSCDGCHQVLFDSGALTEVGQKFESGGYAWPMPEGEAPVVSGAFRTVLRTLFGLIHLLFAVTWIGTILYVHLILRPSYALGGLPRAEMKLAWISIFLIGLSGVGLTWLRFPDLSLLFASRSGFWLTIKVSMYLFLMLSAAFVTIFLSPQLKRLKAGWQQNDGRDGRPIWVKIGDSIYDLSQSPHWKDGTHFKRHQAGTDLTEALAGAPHGEEKLEAFEAMPAKGAQHRLRAGPIKILYTMAYINLSVAVGTVVVVAIWRWA